MKRRVDLDGVRRRSGIHREGGESFSIARFLNESLFEFLVCDIDGDDVTFYTYT